MVCDGCSRLTLSGKYSRCPCGSAFSLLWCRDASDDRYEFELENQAGSAVRLGEDDRRALVTGIALHEKARRTLAQVAAAMSLSGSARLGVKLELLQCRCNSMLTMPFAGQWAYNGLHLPEGQINC